jgi:cytochrome c
MPGLTKACLSIPLLFLFATAPAVAGDVAVGAKEFNKCKSCHSIIADDGTAVVKGGKVGPNLFGVIGRKAGTVPDFNYGASMLAAGEQGLVWDEAQLVSYIQDPTGFLKALLSDDGAKGKMTFKLARKGEDIAAYLASLNAPAP